MRIAIPIHVKFEYGVSQTAIIEVFGIPICSFHCGTQHEEYAERCVARIFKRVFLEGKTIKEAVHEDAHANSYQEFLV